MQNLSETTCLAVPGSQYSPNWMRHTQDEVVDGPEEVIEYEAGSFTPEGSSAVETQAKTELRVERAIIPLWWGGVNSCKDDARVNAELRAHLERWLVGVMNKNPNSNVINNYGRYLQPRLSYRQRSTAGSARKCSANGSMPVFAILSRP